MNEYLNHLKDFFTPAVHNVCQLLKWLLAAVFTGLIVGSAGTLFYFAMAHATRFRLSHDMITYFLPFAGLVIIFLYRKCSEYHNTGTNLILSAIQSGEHISLKIAPLIFISTILTHLFGGSAGREGAALQLGGSLGEFFGNTLKLDDKDKHIMIMCAMSACFSAVFGTPMAAAIFSMEVVSIGIMHYSALVPCVISSFTASLLARYFGAVPETFNVALIPSLNASSIIRIIIIAAILAAASVLFCISLHLSEHLYKKFFKNPYVRVFSGGCLVVAMTILFGTRDYIGAGMPMIAACFTGAVPAFAFLLKILFTAATLGAGFKGGEIVPSFFTGAALGCVIGPLLGFPAPLCAACGMVGVFCGVTNSPVTSLLMSFELFGFEGMPYYLISIAICYTLSGYYGLYSSQKIVYSKYRTEFINTHTK